MRFESKHQQIKSYTNVSSNRRNVCLSSALKLCYQFSAFLMNFGGSTNNIENIIRDRAKPNTSILQLLKIENQLDHIFCKNIMFKGTQYQIDDFIVEEDYGVQIKNIVILHGQVLLVFNKVSTQYDLHLGWYEITAYQQIIYYEELSSFKFYPVKKHISNGKEYIKKLKK